MMPIRLQNGGAAANGAAAPANGGAAGAAAPAGAADSPGPGGESSPTARRGTPFIIGVAGGGASC